MKVEEGKYYLIATREVIGPMVKTGNDTFAPQINRIHETWYNNRFALWRENGLAFIWGERVNKLDIIASAIVTIEEPPKPVKLWINVIETPEGGYMTYSFPSEAEALECPFLEDGAVVHKRAMMIEFTPEESK